MYLYHVHRNIDLQTFTYELDSQLIETVTSENMNHRFFSELSGITSPLSSNSSSFLNTYYISETEISANVFGKKDFDHQLSRME